MKTMSKTMQSIATLPEITQAIARLTAEQQRAWREAHGVDENSALSIDWQTSPMWTPEHRDAVAKALSEWALEQSNASSALKAITRADRRLGVWLACAVARTALRYVDAGESRSRLAIEIAEQWTRGLATEDECRAAYDAIPGSNSRSASYGAGGRIVSAAIYAATSASCAARMSGNIYVDHYAFYSPASAAYDAAHSAAAAATMSAYASRRNRAWARIHDLHLRDLCQTIALAVRDAIDAAAQGYERSQRSSLRSMMQTSSSSK